MHKTIAIVVPFFAPVAAAAAAAVVVGVVVPQSVDGFVSRQTIPLRQPRAILNPQQSPHVPGPRPGPILAANDDEVVVVGSDTLAAAAVVVVVDVAANSSSVMVGLRDIKLIPSKTRTPPRSKHWNWMLSVYSFVFGSVCTSTI